ncbi:probable serine/threonine-protein kinase DDB_G0283337 [Gordionus sp. m RMFG-2023]|uniref:probable serine/threonine-protein kinase DDB_G0283337 n=1 Tax=Gordionus sp. m RMFG-2023 TaxID=3053472 RepID=UPI0031FCEF12
MNRGDRSIPSNVNNPNELFDDKNNDSINDLLADKYPTNHNDKPLDVSSDLFADECEDDLMGLNLESNDAQILAKSDKIENPNHDTFPHLNSNFDLNFSFDENFESNNHLPLSKPKNGTNINNDQSKINKDTEIESKFDILDEDISEEDITMCAHISKNTYFSTDVDIDKVGSDMIGVDKKNEMGSNNVSGNKLDISSNFDLMGIDSTLDRHEFSAVDAQVINEEKVYGSCFDLGLGNDRDNYHVKEELNQQIENDLDKVKPIVKNLETKGESGVKASKGATLPASAKIIQKDNVLYSSFDLGLDEDASIFQNLNIDYDNNNQKMKNDDNKLDKSPSYFQRATENIETRDENNITILKTPNNSHKIKLSPDFMPKKHSTPFADKKRILATLSSNKKNEYESQNENESDQFTREKGTHKSRDDDNIVNDFGSDSDHFIREKVTHKSDDDDNIVNNPGSDNDLEDSFLEVKKNKRKSNKRQNKCVSKKQILKFLDLEAQVDGSASGSDTGLENDEELDNTMLDSFVVRPNSSKYYEGVESESKMEAVYLKSTKNIQGMYGNKFKIKISNNNKQVSYIYSQFPDTQERQETYNQDSFCVDNNMEKSEYDTNHFLTDNDDEYNSIVTHKETSCSKIELPTPGFIQISSSDDSHINVGNKNNRRNDKTKATKRRHNNFVDSDHHEDKDTVISDATDFSIDDESKNIIYKLDSRSKPRVFDKPVPLPRRGYRKFVILPAESKKGPNFITITDDSEDNLIPPKPRNKKYNRIKPLKNGSDSSLEN